MTASPACAVTSLNEANWVRLCTEDGIALIPKTGAGRPEPAGIRTREDVWSTYTTQPPDLIGSPEAITAAQRVAVSTAHRYVSSDPLLIAVGPAIAADELERRHLSTAPKEPGESALAAMSRTFTCDVNDRYFAYNDPEDQGPGELEDCP